MSPAEARAIAKKVVAFLESGTPAGDLFAADVFCDFTMPLWRLQSEGVDGLVALRRRGHPGPGAVTRWRCDSTPNGFVLEFEERWVDAGQEWTSREMARADVDESGRIRQLSVYCTGDWDAARRARHAVEVALVRA